MVARTTQNATSNAASTLGSGLSHIRWSRVKPEDRAAETQPMRDAFWVKLLEQAGGDEVAAENLRQAHYKAMAAKSVAVRRANRDARAAGAK